MGLRAPSVAAPQGSEGQQSRSEALRVREGPANEQCPTGVALPAASPFPKPATWTCKEVVEVLTNSFLADGASCVACSLHQLNCWSLWCV